MGNINFGNASVGAIYYGSNQTAIKEVWLGTTLIWSAESFNVSPLSFTSIPSSGDSKTITVTANCNWTVSTSDSWLHPNINVGSNNGTITVAVDAYSDTTQNRTGSIIITSALGTQRTVSFQQNKAVVVDHYEYRDLSVSINATDTLISASGGSSTLSATATYDKRPVYSDSSVGEWSEQTEILTGSNISGSAQGFTRSGLSVSIERNYDTNSRSVTYTASYTIGGLIDSDDVTITQSGAAVILEFNASSDSFNSYGGSGSVGISSNIAWTIVIDPEDNWITVSPDYGSGNGSISYAVSAKTTPGDRTGHIYLLRNGSTVEDTFTIYQSGTETYNVSANPSSFNLSYTANNASSTITSDHNWSASTNDSWITLTNASGYSGDALTFSVGANYSHHSATSSRTGYISVDCGGNPITITVNQSGYTDYYINQNTSSESVGSGSGSSSHSISTNASSVTASVVDGYGWLSVGTVSTSSIGFSYLANGTVSSRTATIEIVCGDDNNVTTSFTVTQSAGPATLSVSDNDIIVGSNQGDHDTVNVISNTSWTATSNSNQFSVSPASGSGNSVITITANQNNTGDAYYLGIISVSTTEGGNITETIRVTQLNSETPLGTISSLPTRIDIPSSGGTGTVTITASSEWSYTIEDNWIASVTVSGNNATITVTDDTIQGRTGYVSFYLINDPSVSCSVMVKQARQLQPELEL